MTNKTVAQHTTTGHRVSTDPKDCPRCKRDREYARLGESV